MAQTATGKTGNTKSGFSAEERAAMKAAAAERKASQKQADLDQALADTIAALPAADREIAAGIDAIVREHAPSLTAKTYYGMPGWARDGKMCIFVQPSSKFNYRYSTLGFEQTANLDDGAMWPTAFAIEKLGPEEKKRIVALVQQAVR
jgi:uncharacterized protein YdhG (YjbR/CyaY superfamily)